MRLMTSSARRELECCVFLWPAVISSPMGAGTAPGACLFDGQRAPGIYWRAVRPSRCEVVGVKPRDLAAAAIFAALTFVVTRYTLIPIPATKGYFNLGEVVIYIA